MKACSLQAFARLGRRRLDLHSSGCYVSACLLQRRMADHSDRLMNTSGGSDPPYPAAPDCGRVCHNPECEKRHLDEIEVSRWQNESFFQYPRRPQVVVTASRDMGRTASTWVFNAVRLLFRQAHEACDSYWIRELSRDKITRRLATGAHVLVKTHEWTDNITEAQFDAVSPLFTQVIVSVRQGFQPDPAWMAVATHVTHFEDIVAHDESGQKIGAVKVLKELAAHLGITSLTDNDFCQIDYALMAMPIPGDQTTKFWSFHGRRGGRPQPSEPTPTE
eukprot:TRINITY_DN30830_c0_g1_i1.p1 TRINITY_DN30830_c0_g1~~TRINITY_DN30830_c0_g1_i1.p1  ORF type:complete len:276 (+),score=6.80 TRINITY_DN30830_c0_g1_i1:46-873(+)